MHLVGWFIWAFTYFLQKAECSSATLFNFFNRLNGVTSRNTVHFAVAVVRSKKFTHLRFLIILKMYYVKCPSVTLSLFRQCNSNSRRMNTGKNKIYVCFLWRYDPTRVMASSFLRFLDHTQRRTTVGRTPLDEWSGRRRDLCLTTPNTHNRQISMPHGTRTHDLSRRAAADLRLRPRGHWGRQIHVCSKCISKNV